jgi:hypothetical protein
LTIAKMPARIASGNSGHATTTGLRHSGQILLRAIFAKASEISAGFLSESQLILWERIMDRLALID